MSLITRCPACATRFRVVPDQLKISDGWVRCGQCGEVFDAQASLVEPEPAPVAAYEPENQPEYEPEYEPPPLHPVPEDLPGPAGDTAPEPDLQWTTPLEPALRPGQPAQPEPAAAQEAAPAEAGSDPALDTVAGPAADLDPGADPAPVAGPAPGLDDLSFVRQARRRALWQRPVVRVALVVLAFLLGLLLAAQVAVQQRDTLAQGFPQLRPVLEALCQPIGCRVGPPRRIEALVIDHSAFSRLRPDAYRLAVTLANRSPIPVALPALELTLTDSQDAAIVRRVIAPAELGQGAASIVGANAQWTTSLTVAVTPDATTARIVGYRLLAFYP